VKVFRSARHKFEIAVPDSWECPSEGFLTRLLGGSLIFKGPDGEMMQIDAGAMSTEQTLSEFRRSFRAYLSRVGSDNDDAVWESLAISGASCFVVSYSLPDRTIRKKYSLQCNGFEYVITCILGRVTGYDLFNRYVEEILGDSEISGRADTYASIVKTFRRT
jgi:hypothetical protein